MRHDLRDDPGTIGIAGATGLDRDTVVGKLHRFWSWADRQTLDGNAAGVTGDWVDTIVEHPGFAAALITVGWLEETDAGISLPHFDRWISETAKQRALTAKRVAKHRGKCNGAIVTTEQNRTEQKILSLSNDKEPSGPLKLFQTAWNSSGFPKIRSFTAKRERSFRLRLKDSDWDWQGALDRAKGSDFLMGKNDRGWSMNVDFFLRPDSVTRILEGEFDNGKSKGDGGGDASDYFKGKP